MIRKIRIRGYRLFDTFELDPNPSLNVIVGPNESGKSTLLEAVCLALTWRVNGRTAPEEFSPYWFNTKRVREFVTKRASGQRVAFPDIAIELYFDDRDDLQELCGAVNDHQPTLACPGVRVHAFPNPEYTGELEKWAENPSPILPVEYYKIEWRSFADKLLTARPKALTTAVIDSRTVRSTTAVDYHLKEILGDHLRPAERAAIALEYRQVKQSMSDTALKGVNERISKLHATLHDRSITLAMDQSARTSWEWSVTPHVENVPFPMSGQGQQAAIKISLAMNKHSQKARFVTVEEPENHLSHTSLNVLLARMESLRGDEQQLFVTTHSSFVLNRLGLDALLLMSASSALRIPQLTPDTVSYFQRLPGYDTLRLALAPKIVLVEGPSDEILFDRIFKDKFGTTPIRSGIDVISMRGLSLQRCLELCQALDKTVAALRDNDGSDPADLRTPIEKLLAKGRRELFVGAVAAGETLEPQLVHANSEAALRGILALSADTDLAKWMKREKTECALRIAASTKTINPPPYMREAADFIHG